MEKDVKKSMIGSQIESIRERRGITRSELAYKVGVTPAAVWNWEEQGTRPRAAILRDVARVLGVSEEELLTGKIPSAVDKNTTGSLSEIIEDARRKIAVATGVPVERVKLTLEVVTEN